MPEKEVKSIMPKFEKVTIKEQPVEVRELRLEDLQKIFLELFTVVSALDSPEVRSGDKTAILSILSKPELKNVVISLFGAVTDQPEGFFNNVTLVDLMRLLRAFLKLNDIKELVSLFKEIQEMVS